MDHTPQGVSTEYIIMMAVSAESNHVSDSSAASPPEGSTSGHSTHKHRSTRERSLFVGLNVSGVARVSGVEGGWEV